MNRVKVEIKYDTAPENPREWDCLSTLALSHPRYDISDEGVDLQDAFEQVEGCDIHEPYWNHDCEGVTIEEVLDVVPLEVGMEASKYVRSACSYDDPGNHSVVIIAEDGFDYLMEKLKGWDTEGRYYPGYEWPDGSPKTDWGDYLIERDDLAIITPVSLYDHSGTNLLRGHHTGWDVGMVGWQYVTEESLHESYPILDHEDALHQANKVMASELDVYSKYLNGEVYQVNIFVNGEFKDALSGIYDLDESLVEQFDVDYQPYVRRAIEDWYE